MRKWFTGLLFLALVLGSALPGVSASQPLPFTIVFKSGTLPANAAEIVEAAGGTVTATHPELGILYATGPGSLMKLNDDAAIEAVSRTIEFKLEPMHMVELNAAEAQAANPAAADLYHIYQWDIKQVTKDGASWNLSTGSHRTVVGIIDTGISTQHPALKANLLGGRNFTPDGPGGTVDPDDIEDRHGHGSHVAGNIAGNGRILGVGPDLGIRAYRVFGATGGSPSSRIVEAIYAAVNDGVDVISMSLGGFDSISGYTWTDPATGEVYKYKDVADHNAYRRAVQYANSHGVVVVAAAGNDAMNITNPPTITQFLNQEYGPYGYNFKGASMAAPGTIPGVITVSATGPDQSLASYSNWGPSAITLAAPGGDFQNYPNPGWHLDMNLSAYVGTGYVFMAGTSMATPKVSAVAALIIDQAKASGQTLTPSQVAAKLQQTAVDLGKKGHDPYFGHGFSSAYTALGGN